MRLANDIFGQLPMLRRYARAVLGHQGAGDEAVVQMLERLALSSERGDELSPRMTLFRALADVLRDGAHGYVSELAPTDEYSRHLLRMTLNGRQALLLMALEAMSERDVAVILRSHDSQIREYVASAREELSRSLATDVLIIEDEYHISKDIANIVTGLGHRVLARSKTHAEAITALKRGRPGLVLADIHLADGSSGIEAAVEILKSVEVPVVFITAYPDQFLTGAAIEPTYLVSKPYNVEELRTLISSSLFFKRCARLTSQEDPKSTGAVAPESARLPHVR